MNALSAELKPESYALVKLGGSVITQENGEIDLANVISLCSEIAQYRFPLILVHGGGYFMKRMLLDFNIKTDFFSVEQAPLAFHLRNSLIQLNKVLVDTLQEVGIHAIPIPAHSKFRSRNGKIVPDKSVSQLLNVTMPKEGLPVLFGDVLDEEAGGFYFTSSDKIVSCLAKVHRPRIILFLSNVNGVYESFPPMTANESVLPVVTPNILDRLENNYDVGRGEIYGKLVEAIDCASQTDDCRIINGKVPGNLLGSLYGRLEVGTKILAEITQ